MAEILRCVGIERCAVGEIATGSRLLEESVRVFNEFTTEGERFLIGEVWYQLGNAHLAEDLRQESLMARVMQLARDEMLNETRTQTEAAKESSSSSSISSSGSDSDDEEEGDAYCTCLYDAVSCYSTSLSVLRKETKPELHAELRVKVLTNLADCHVMTGNLDLAESLYEESLSLFCSTFGFDLLQRNAHVLTMLGTLSFLTGNFVRSATMFETAQALRQRLDVTKDDPDLETAWTLTMLALSYFMLGRYYKSIVWCIRAFTHYTRFFRGKILDVDPLNRWFIVRTLYVVGFAYVHLTMDKKALYYLNLGKNMAINTDKPDRFQVALLLKLLGDAHASLEDKDMASHSYLEAAEYLKSANQDSEAVKRLKRQLTNRIAGNKDDDQSESRDGVCDKDLDTSIKSDVTEMLMRIGLSNTFDCAVDDAIGCYTECIEAFAYQRQPDTRQVAATLAKLGKLHHVKARMLDDARQAEALLRKADDYFRQAIELDDREPSIIVQYANFMCQCGRCADALQTLLPVVFCSRPDKVFVEYDGIEQLTLPEHLQSGPEEEVEFGLVFNVGILAKFVAIQCFKTLSMHADLDDVIVRLYRDVMNSKNSIDHVILGYGLLEAYMHHEAAMEFMLAARICIGDRRTILRKAWLCCLLGVYCTIARGIGILLELLFARWSQQYRLLTFEDFRACVCSPGGFRASVARRRKPQTTGSSQSSPLPVNLPTCRVQRNCDVENGVIHANRMDVKSNRKFVHC